jgi:hypothetical protein
MYRRFLFVVALVPLALATSSASAGWSEFWHRTHIDWHRVNCWPEPFAHADRQVTVAPFITMADAGWRLQNTLNEHFFEGDVQILTSAGRHKVHWIATQAPLHRRTVFVLRGRHAGETEARVAAVRNYLLELLPEGAQPDVLLTDVVPPGGSGEYFDEVDRQRTSNIPAPTLPEMQGTTGGNL